MSRLSKVRRHPVVRRVVHLANHHRSTVALVVAIVAGLGLVGVGLSLYYGTGFYRYDLSRPGYEKERTEIAKPEPQANYDTTSPVSKATIDTFLTEFDTRNKTLKAYGDFRDTSLSDEDLQIIPQ
jgi:hypothetical protein